MAEGIVHEGKSLEQMEKEITCAICQEYYTEPKVLPCLHYYCKKCILKLAFRVASNEPFSCPECRQDTTLPEGGVEELKTAFFVNRFQSHFSVIKRVYGKAEVKCEACINNANKAESFCRQCAIFICQECTKQHKRMKSFDAHQVVSMEELKQGTARDIVIKEHPIEKCPIDDKPLVIYCFDCHCLVCRDCTTTAHKDHKFEFCKVAAPDTKKNILDYLNPLKAAGVVLLGVITDIQTTKQEIEAQGKSVANTIHTSFNELQLILDNCKQELLHQAADLVQEKISKLAVQEINLSAAAANVQSIVDNTEQFLKNCSDYEVMSMHAEIRRRIEQEMKEHSQSGRNLEPVQEADLGVEVRLSEALQQLCQTQAKITQQAIDPAECTVRGEGARTAEVNHTATVTLTTQLTNKVTTRHKAEVVSELKTVRTESVTKCEVEQSGPGEYQIQYKPTVRGRHELTVSVDGQQVAGSPFPVFVCVSPIQLGKPLKVWHGINGPKSVTVNSMGEIIIAEYNGDILKIDKNGSKRVLLKHSKTKLAYLSCIAIDNQNNIYCTDIKSNKIMKCDKSGGNIQVHEVQQLAGPGFRGVAVIGNEVMACECNNKGTIVVYNRELKYVRCIEHEDMGTFHRISADQQGNLYVTDFTLAHIHVFSNDGVILRSFGCDHAGVNKLNGPYGVCVSGQHVYVTNWYGNNVSVFTTSGDYVTSFGGRYGNKQGNFNSPCGVYVDVDNFIYVASHKNDRVPCF